MSSYVIKYGEVISLDVRRLIAKRYRTITAAINREFWNSKSKTEHSLYVGSYGRGTAINTSDIDMIAILPEDEYKHYDSIKGNGQSRLLQAVKIAIMATYPRTNIHADGQVVVINFSDGMKFEVVPVFIETDYVWGGNETFVYPDTNNGGNWKSANPKDEQIAMNAKNQKSNGLLKDTCKHIRYIRDTNFSSYHLSGILIDSFAYLAIENWYWAFTDEKVQFGGSRKYVQHLLDFYQDNKEYLLTAPGSKQSVKTDDYPILEKILRYMVE